ncbi:MAG TPA: hypothetical protein VHU92_27050, partial [Streptosporangiaceae bacterium]|nr:hypothetical protein [Streptosporangiaceae bacterium]
MYTYSDNPTKVSSWKNIKTTAYASPPDGQPSVTGTNLLGQPDIFAFWPSSGYQKIMGGWIPKHKGDPENFKNDPLGSDIAAYNFTSEDCACVVLEAFWEGARTGLWGLSDSAPTGIEPAGEIYKG